MAGKKIHPQQQIPPGKESLMNPHPQSDDNAYKGSGKLQRKVAIITGGDSGIGKSVGIFFAKEGADSIIIYSVTDEDAQKTKHEIESLGRQCLLIKGDVGDETFCFRAVEQGIKELGHIDILVNNAAEQHPQKTIEEITKEQLEKTFRTNVYAYFYMTKACLKYLHEGSCIINTTSVTAYKGSPELLDYSSTKGAIVAFTRSLSQNLAQRKIRVNGVAPGPIWTPLIPSTFPEEKVEGFGTDVPLQRAGQPEEIAPSFVFLASDDSSYMTGQILHPNAGTVVNG